MQPTFEDFQEHYSAFLNDFISQYKGKLKSIIIGCGPMVFQMCPAVKKSSEDVAAAFPALKVRYVDVTLKPEEKVCLWHPSVAGDRSMLEIFKPVISELTNWT